MPTARRTHYRMHMGEPAACRIYDGKWQTCLTVHGLLQVLRCTSQAAMSRQGSREGGREAPSASPEGRRREGSPAAAALGGPSAFEVVAGLLAERAAAPALAPLLRGAAPASPCGSASDVPGALSLPLSRVSSGLSWYPRRRQGMAWFVTT